MVGRYRIKEVKGLIAMIKIVAPMMTQNVVDRATRLADGLDEVHMYQLGWNTVRQYTT